MSTEQVRSLRGGSVRPVRPADVLFRVGDRDADLVVVLSGGVAVLDGVPADARLLRSTAGIASSATWDR